MWTWKWNFSSCPREARPTTPRRPKLLISNDQKHWASFVFTRPRSHTGIVFCYNCSVYLTLSTAVRKKESERKGVNFWEIRRSCCETWSTGTVEKNTSKRKRKWKVSVCVCRVVNLRWTRADASTLGRWASQTELREHTDTPTFAFLHVWGPTTTYSPPGVRVIGVLDVSQSCSTNLACILGMSLDFLI